MPTPWGIKLNHHILVAVDGEVEVGVGQVQDGGAGCEGDEEEGN